MKDVTEYIEEIVGKYKIIAWKDESGYAGLISGYKYYMSMLEANDGSKFNSLRQVVNQSKIFLGCNDANKQVVTI